ncbi:MAG: hypothetical protein HYR63_25015 [Proteobacteria bacterium]|nr:hypothetical protein [Pseudomonadota bacterium]MBI3497190.1 hypothetical protein [Pseudomonadota bacterium]
MAQGHHEIFDRFARTAQQSHADCVENFVGAKTRHEYEAELPPTSAGQKMPFSVSGRSLTTDEDPSLPERLSEDYFEWIDMLEAIDQAKGQFVMVELGAGYGRWLVNAAAAVRRHKVRPNIPARFIGVEASPLRFRWLVQNFKDNQIDVATNRLVWGAVSDDEEPGFFPIYHAHWIGNQGHTYGAPFEKSDGSRFQRVDLKTDLNKLYPDVEYYVCNAAPGQLFIKVPSFSLARLIAVCPRVDLIDMDVQGAELAIVRSGMAELSRKVKRVHIATHGEDIEREIAQTFAASGWQNVWCMPYNRVHATIYGEMYFCDGIQGWKNPAFS